MQKKWFQEEEKVRIYMKKVGAFEAWSKVLIVQI